MTRGARIDAVVTTRGEIATHRVVNAAGGQCKPLPLIGHYQLIK